MLALLIALTGCSEQAQVEATQAPEAAATTVEAHGDEAHGEAHGEATSGIGLTLDGGDKWQMDEHTRGVMTDTRRTLAKSNVSSATEAAALNVTLQGQLDSLIQGCTMDGPAHDQLHVFLIAWMPAVAGLKEASDEDAQVRVAGVRDMVAEYDRYFE